MHGQTTLGRALCDTGSQINLISERLANTLALKRTQIKTHINGIGGNMAAISKERVSFQMTSLHDSNFTLQVEAYAFPRIFGGTASHCRIDTSNHKHLASLQLADPDYSRPGPIDILLGADTYGRLLMKDFICGEQNQPHAQRTQLGWIVFGITQMAAGDVITLSVSSNCSNDELNQTLKRFWDLEKAPLAEEKLTLEEKLALEDFQKTHYRSASGRYYVQYPFKPDAQELGDSYWLAKTQFLQLERRSQRNPELREKYIDFMRQHEALGYMQLADQKPKDPKKAYYIPHHAVLGKFRVVCNASAKTTNGLSLNDILLTGPILQSSSYHINLRFRKYPVAVTADIAKMFLQVGMSPKHIDYQRILWREKPEDDLEEYLQVTVVFGTASGTSTATLALRQCALDYPKWIEKSNPSGLDASALEAIMEAIKSILKDMYVDDYAKSLPTADKAIKMATDVHNILETGHFHLRKWNSNSLEVLKALALDISGEESVALPQDGAKILGIDWNAVHDTYSFSVPINFGIETKTKRTILGDIARLYDPTGLLAPVIITGKIFMQSLWKLANTGWDTVIPKDLRMTWKKYHSSLAELVQIIVPRWIGFQPGATTTLHAFADASKLAYAAVIFARTVDSNRKVTVSIITSKTRVASMQEETTPRLELRAALLATELLVDVREALEESNIECHCYTDSTIVLSWLRKPALKQPVFIANRIRKIQKFTKPEQWHHVGTDENPADCASRGITPHELQQFQLWWHGPTFLHVEPGALRLCRRGC